MIGLLVMRITPLYGIYYMLKHLAQHWVIAQRVKVKILDLPVPNLEGKEYAKAEKAYFNDLLPWISDIQAYLLPARYRFSRICKELDGFPEETLDFHSASQKVR